FLLREVFEYSYAEIGEMLNLSPANCRQIFHRAQQQIALRRPRFEPSQEAQRRLVERFVRACQNGDMAALSDMLAQDVVAWSDGGGKVHAALKPVIGRTKVLRFIAGLARKMTSDMRVELALINGAPATLLFTGPALFYAATFSIAGEQIH